MYSYIDKAYFGQEQFLNILDKSKIDIKLKVNKKDMQFLKSLMPKPKLFSKNFL